MGLLRPAMCVCRIAAAFLLPSCRLSVAEVLPLAQGILQGLFNAFQQPDSSENEYLMRAVMRLISFLGPQIAPVAPMCLQVRGAGVGVGIPSSIPLSSVNIQSCRGWWRDACSSEEVCVLACWRHGGRTKHRPQQLPALDGHIA